MLQNKTQRLLKKGNKIQTVNNRLLQCSWSNQEVKESVISNQSTETEPNMIKLIDKDIIITTRKMFKGLKEKWT